MLLFNHTYYQLIETKGVLIFKWHEAHPQMSYPDFQAACSNFAGYAMEKQTGSLLIDTHNFAFELPPEYPQWNQETHLPRLIRAGVNRMAYVMAKEHMDFVTYKEDSVPLQRYFTSEEVAMNWLLSAFA